MDRDTYDRIKELSEQVEELESRVEKLENAEAPTETAVDGADQYDQYVLDRIEIVGEKPDPKQIITLYKEAGVRNVSKIKDRHKFLKRTGKIQAALEGEETDA